MDKDERLKQLQPSIRAVVAFWKEQLLSDHAHTTFDLVTDQVLHPSDRVQDVPDLRSTTLLATRGKMRLMLQVQDQIDLFGNALHQAIERMIVQAEQDGSNPYLADRRRSERAWRFGMEYDPVGMASSGES